MSGGHRLERARRMLALPEGWLDCGPEGYALRSGPDRRARVMLTLDEAEFRALKAEPGLTPREGGGWIAGAPLPSPAPGRPGVTEGVRVVMNPDGSLSDVRANLTPSPIRWLAGRTGADGQPWLSPAQVAAAEQLEIEAETALRGASVTMRWDALPGTSAGGGPWGYGPGDRALAAARRVEKALTACGPARELVRIVCVTATPLQTAEQTLGLRRRTGRTLLQHGLTLLARHYRLL